MSMFSEVCEEQLDKLRKELAQLQIKYDAVVLSLEARLASRKMIIDEDPWENILAAEIEDNEQFIAACEVLGLDLDY